MMGCRLRDCGALDCPTCMGAAAARQYRAEQECDHDEHDHGHCLACSSPTLHKTASPNPKHTK